MSKRESWHLNKGIPVTLIIVIVVQTCSFVWYGAKLDSKVNEVAEKMAAIELWKETQNGTAAKTDSRLAVIEERTTEQSETMHRIENRLESITIKK